jgi:transposase
MTLFQPNQIHSSRRLEAECRRNVEGMWLLERLYPDYKSIADRTMVISSDTDANRETIVKDCLR